MKGPKPPTIVIKLGTSSIVDEKTYEHLLPVLTLIVSTAVQLRKDGHKVIIVSSGAIGTGLQRMDCDRRPKHLSKLQALAAIGQCRLLSLWDGLFGHYRQPVAQILLTRNDIADRSRYLNAQNTMTELLEMGVIPIVNENDTLAVAEIKFGDNDTLSAITAAMVHADYLFLMTDVDCLYDKNPRTCPDARPIEVVEDIETIEADVSSAGSSLGTGGMSTKIVAARLATSAGVTTIITRSSNPGNISQIVAYLQSLKNVPPPSHSSTTSTLLQPTPETQSTAFDHDPSLLPTPLHTRFLPLSQPMSDRYFWILHGLAPHGTVYIDSGAAAALADKAGLLPVGVVDVEGNFAQHEAVRLVVVDRIPATSSSSSPSSSSSSSSSSSLDQHNNENGHSHNNNNNHHATAHKTWDPNGQREEIGRAIVNYAAGEITRIKGYRSCAVEGLLGYADSEYVADRSNVSLLRRSRDSRPVSPSPNALNEAAAKGGTGK